MENQSFSVDKLTESWSAGSASEQTEIHQVTPTAESIYAWLVRQLSGFMGVEPEAIDGRRPFTSYGLSSREAIILSGYLEDWLQIRLPANIVWEYPNIESLSQHLAGKLTSPGRVHKRT